MLDMKLIRGETEKVKAALARRKEDIDIDAVIALDDSRRGILYEVEGLKARQNEASKKIPAMKKAGEDTAPVFAEMKEISEKVKALDEQVKEVETKIYEAMLRIPNIPNDEVPDGDTDEDNVEIRRYSEPTKFDFEPKAHWDIGADLGILDPDTAAKITGARFHVYKDKGARLERAIINYFLDMHTEKHGYMEVFPPFMVHRNSMVGTGQLPKFEEDAYKVAGTEYFLVPTAEVPVTNMYREQILDGDQLPIKHVAYTACFRQEAGSAGRDGRGL
ncbi:MAG: serine--tRNA ligase, partial [Oscillospiraceae bacterium]|nr:serine--tRNA ligase [Oscillospiraceae bacterium]